MCLLVCSFARVAGGAVCVCGGGSLRPPSRMRGGWCGGVRSVARLTAGSVERGVTVCGGPQLAFYSGGYLCMPVLGTTLFVVYIVFSSCCFGATGFLVVWRSGGAGVPIGEVGGHEAGYVVLFSSLLVAQGAASAVSDCRRSLQAI